MTGKSPMIGAKAAAAEAGITQALIRDWRRRGLIDGVGERSGERWRYTQPDVEALTRRAHRRVLDTETLRELLAAAYVAGCEAVHANYRPDPDPEFGEAADDYAASVICKLSRHSPDAPPAELA